MCNAENLAGSDRELLERLKKGDVEAFDRLFEKHRRGILAYVYGMVRDYGTAEDITQECFVRLVKKIGRIKPEKGASPWLYRVARNLAIDTIRRRKFEVVPGDDLAGIEREDGQAGELERPDVSAEASDDRALVTEMLASLPEKERELLVLRFFSGLGFREIAETVKRPLGTVLWQVRRSLQKLKEEHERRTRGL